MSLVFPAGRPQRGVMTTLPPRKGNYSLKSSMNLWHNYITARPPVKSF